MKFFVDTNVFIYFYEEEPEFVDKAEKILKKVDETPGMGFTSTLILKEICWYFESLGEYDKLESVFQNIINSNISIITVNVDHIKKAVSLKKEHKRIELNDLINYYVMKDNAIRVIFSNDDHFDKLSGIERKF